MNKRFVCVVIENDQGRFDCIGGDDFVNLMSELLKAYEFTDHGVDSIYQGLLGNEPPAINPSVVMCQQCNGEGFISVTG